MNRGRILLVEDYEPNSRLFRILLEAAGYEVVTAVEAEEGIRLARELHPALILMDISLPGMDGIEATRKLRALPEVAEVPVVALTAHVFESVEHEALAAGMREIITKPIDRASFLAKVARWMSSSTSPGASKA